MLKIFKSNRCGICFTERFMRDCPRKKRKLCWRCCNDLRCDSLCPSSCSYSAKADANSPFPNFKADSRTEAMDVLKKTVDFWVGHQNPLLDDKTPLQYAQESSQGMFSWLSGFQFPAQFPVEYMMQRLNLPIKEAEAFSDAEACAEHYMDAIIRLAYNELRSFTPNQNPLADLEERYTELIQAITDLSQVTAFNILNSALSEDGMTTLVFVELNHRKNWTLVLSRATGEWKIRQNIADSPQVYFNQNNEYNAIADALGKADDAKAWDLLEANKKLYPDSPDLYYYRGLYWQLVKEYDKAAVDFFNAVALDNNWAEPFFNLGMLSINKADFAQAGIWFLETTKLQPDNLNARNNLASCYAATGNKLQAKEIWENLLQEYPTFELAKTNLERLERG